MRVISDASANLKEDQNLRQDRRCRKQRWRIPGGAKTRKSHLHILCVASANQYKDAGVAEKPTKMVGEEIRVNGRRVGWPRKRSYLLPGGLNLRKGTLNPKSAAEWVNHSARSRKSACG